MKKFRKTMAALTAIAALAVSVNASGFTSDNSAIIADAAVDDCNDDWLHAVGSRLYDKDGNEVWLTGANWFGFNCGENLAHGLYAADCDEFLSNVADKGINLVRIPISTELLVSWMNGTPNPVSSVNAGYNPPEDIIGEDGTVTKAGSYVNINKDFVLSDGKTIKDSMEIFDVIMKKMKDYGLKVMIDVHSPAAHNSGHNYNLWYYNPSAEQADGMAVGADGKEITYDMWKDSITWLAEKYNNDDTIIGYDLKNEPHGKRGYDGTTCPEGIAKWDGSTDLNNWAYSATDCANSILKVNPNALIMIEGVEQYPKTEKGYTYDTADIWQASAEVSPWYGAWWGGNLRGVKDYPITPDSGTSQIVYSPHDYGPSVYDQTWFQKDFTTQTLLDDYWYDTWAYINDKEIAPLLIGEWGGHMDGGKNQKWMELLRDYMINNHINHTFWCLNPNSGDTGGLLGYDFTTWDDEKYDLFEPSLWQTQETGKYIGLDHQKSLGNNGTGLSVTEFYDSYAYTEGSNIDGGTVLSDKPTPPTTEPKTTAPITTEPSTAPPTTKEPTTVPDDPKIVWGDASGDGDLSITDAVKILSYASNPEKSKIENADYCDIYNRGDGIDVMDALSVQKKLTNAILTLPESYLDAE